MKKRFFKLGIFTSALVSAFALASCNGDSPVDSDNGNSSAKVKDLSGNDYEIETTTDSDKALMSLFLAANTVKDTNKHYAVGTTLKVDADLDGTMPGATVSLDASINTTVKASIGKNAYTSVYDLTRTLGTQNPTEEQLNKALDEVNNNFKAEASFGAKLKTKIVQQQQLTAEETGSASSEGPNMVAEIMAMLADCDIEFNADLFTKAPGAATEGQPKENLKVYGEVSAKIPASFDDFAGMATQFIPEIVQTPSTVEGNPTSYAYDFYLPAITTNRAAARIASIFAAYQNASTNIGAINTLGQAGMFGNNVKGLVPVVTASVDSIFNADFFTSNTYTDVKKVAKELGLKVTAIDNGKVTFTLDVTGKALNSLSKMGETENNLTAQSTEMFDDTKTYSNLELAIDVTNGIISKYKVSIPKVENIFDLVKTNSTLTLGSISIKDLTLAGSFSIELTCDIDDAVTFTKTPSATKTYALLDIDAIMDQIDEMKNQGQQGSQVE